MEYGHSRAEDNVETEAKIGLLQLQVKECQGLLGEKHEQDFP